jgi:hypothetical protein
MTQHTTTRTCDALGVCQAQATPCAGCSNTHPAYHHLHRVHHTPAAKACTADQCQQGRTACPCPQACELPGTDADPLREDPATAFELVGVVLVVASLAGVLLFTVKACAGA